MINMWFSIANYEITIKTGGPPECFWTTKNDGTHGTHGENHMDWFGWDFFPRKASVFSHFSMCLSGVNFPNQTNPLRKWRCLLVPLMNWICWRWFVFPWEMHYLGNRYWGIFCFTFWWFLFRKSRIPSGKLPHNYGKSPFSCTISLHPVVSIPHIQPECIMYMYVYMYVHIIWNYHASQYSVLYSMDYIYIYYILYYIIYILYVII